MKQLTLLLILTSSLTTFAQTKQCDCSGPLSKDLLTISQTSEYHQLKEFLYTYFKSDSSTEVNMKSDKHYGWTSSAEAVVDAVPVKGTGNANIDNSDQTQTFSHLEQLYIKNSYLTDEEFNQAFASSMSGNQLTAYLACLQLCKGILASGVTYNIGGDSTDVLSIQINFKSTPAGGQIKLKGDAMYPGLEPIGPLVFKADSVIKDGSHVLQYFKRLDPTKPASFSFNADGVEIGSIDFHGSPAINTQQIPIGTIVASVLNYKNFLEANGLTLTGDMTKAIWVPCDGRVLSVNASTYSKFGTVPDLRGVFLRGINDYGVTYSGVANVSEKQKNTKDKKAGEFQGDEVGSHSHQMLIVRDPKLGFRSGISGAGYNTGQDYENATRQDSYQYSTSAFGGNETMPRNITVYYYIKIN